jgi:excisionase family DNA binding protein
MYNIKKQTTMKQEKVKILDANKEILTTDEAAVFLGIAKGTLYQLTHRKEIPYFKLGGKLNRFSKSELIEWMKRSRIEEKGKFWSR